VNLNLVDLNLNLVNWLVGEFNLDWLNLDLIWLVEFRLVNLI
jgi:hypothetical protein